ncbi:hypothetical protein [Thalassospira tepidiphila]|uniref:Uncharacterized protein n=1 Tax=Thalassospira tepidiphila TaxID=393657 RepID=A0ABX0WZA4_9PROT|nr:hypothetical protein [Thalassospira tepidiphila]NJB74621.1 hypothetical protein [Thalassospira tepidiphila]
MKAVIWIVAVAIVASTLWGMFGAPRKGGSYDNCVGSGYTKTCD